MKNYIVYHLHDDRSLLDSATKFSDYVDKAVSLKQNAICLTNHGNVYNWVSNKQLCDKMNIKYIHGVEIYLTEKLYVETTNEKGETKNSKVRDNYHTILIAKNHDGLLEINKLISLSNTENHFYHKNRITFDEFLDISDNVITTSACLASPLNNEDIIDVSYYDKLCKKYTYYEVQPHANSDEQKAFNKKLYELSIKYNKPLIAGTDTHNIDKYKAECRGILQSSKGISFTNEDDFDLTYKTYDELVKMFETQGVLDESVYLEAIENTNVMADSVEDFELDKSFKYPILYDDEEKITHNKIVSMFKDKIKRGIIPTEQIDQFKKNILEEFAVFKQIKMIGFMLFMSELISWCNDNDIPVGFGRGSVCGSSIAYILGITDVNPVQWHTVFSRFANKYRLELGDIDCDFAPEDREKVYNHIFDKFSKEYSCYVLALGTAADKGCIDLIGRALKDKHGQLKYSLTEMKEIKKQFEDNEESVRNAYPDIFYYFDGLVGVYVSQSMHPAGVIVSPITLRDNYGTTIKDDMEILQLDMNDCHDVNLVKYDILGLATVGIIKNTCELVGIKYPKSHEIDWNDEKVFDSLNVSNVGLFQFESDFSHKSMKTFGCHSVDDISLVTAAIRPSGSSYRDVLFSHTIHHNPSSLIDDLLSNSYGYLVYQEQIIAFLQQICGLSGGDADNVRRAIGKKDADRLQKALPSILEGYCKVSTQPRDIAENEAKTFLKIIEDSSSYMFGYNHSLAYSMITYLCAYYRYYYPYEFTCAYLNASQNDDDINMGAELIKTLGYTLKSPKFRHSKAGYFFDKNIKAIYKGVSSIKFLSELCANELYDIGQTFHGSFLELLNLLTIADTRQISILIKLGYFEEFGKSGKLLKFYKLYQEFNGKNTFKKQGTYSVPINILKIFCEKETPKQYSKFNSNAFLSYQWDEIKDTELSLKVLLDAEFEYCGSLSYVNSKLLDIYYVVKYKEYNNVNKPYVTLYHLADGTYLKTNVTSQYNFMAKPFNLKSVIKILMYRDEKRKKLDIETKKWYNTEEVKVVIDDWMVIDGGVE